MTLIDSSGTLYRFPALLLRYEGDRYLVVNKAHSGRAIALIVN